MANPLWAPWRMPYILRSDKSKGPRDSGCFFCDHAAAVPSFRDNLVVVAQEHAFVCLNRYPFTPSHLLVTPRRHVSDLADLSEEEYAALMKLLRESTVRLRKAVNCSAMNVGFNLGEATAGGSIPHLHGHIVPRWNGDNNFMPVLAQTRVLPQSLDTTWEKLWKKAEELKGPSA